MSRILRFGTGGTPLSATKRDAISGLKRIAELGLGHMELEFVHGVRMSPENALEVGKIAEKEQVSLSIHGPYYVNLAAVAEETVLSSIKHIVNSIKIGQIMGAKSVTFHPAYYTKFSKEEVATKVESAILDIWKEIRVDKDLKKCKFPVLSPELTGKPSQFGSLEELVALVKRLEDHTEISETHFCIDFAHNFARNQGKYNSRDEIMTMFELISKQLGDEFLQNMHFHISGIIFGEKGEKHHVTYLPDYKDYQKAGVDFAGGEKIMESLQKTANRTIPSDLDWKMILDVLKQEKIGGFVVCESPNLELDALLMQTFYDSL